MRESIFQYVLQKYHIKPDHPFLKSPTCQALRHQDNRKIFALIMNVKKGKLGIEEKPEEYMDILNLEADIPYSYSDQHVSMSKVMRLQVVYTFGDSDFPMQKLRTYGVTTVRGPRSIPEPLLQDLKLFYGTVTSQNHEEV